MTPAQRTLARHALAYRNRYFVLPDSPNGKQWVRCIYTPNAPHELPATKTL